MAARPNLAAIFHIVGFYGSRQLVSRPRPVPVSKPRWAVERRTRNSGKRFIAFAAGGAGLTGWRRLRLVSAWCVDHGFFWRDMPIGDRLRNAG